MVRIIRMSQVTGLPSVVIGGTEWRPGCPSFGPRGVTAVRSTGALQRPSPSVIPPLRTQQSGPSCVISGRWTAR